MDAPGLLAPPPTCSMSLAMSLHFNVYKTLSQHPGSHSNARGGRTHLGPRRPSWDGAALTAEWGRPPLSFLPLTLPPRSWGVPRGPPRCPSCLLAHWSWEACCSRRAAWQRERGYTPRAHGQEARPILLPAGHRCQVTPRLGLLQHCLESMERHPLTCS